MAIAILFFLIGLILIIKGGDFFVDASVWIAEASGMPKFLIGATIVSMATTIPELLVSLISAAEGNVGMCCGNAIGSVTANLGLIFGISIVCIPAVLRRGDIAFKGILMIAACAFLFLFSRSGELSIGGSLVILALFAVYVTYNIFEARKANSSDDSEKVSADRRSVITNIVKFVGGAAAIAVGARLLVDYGSEMARSIGISDAIISVTLVAIGTSLPELVTTITAISRKESSLSIGNIIGANVIDLSLILPLCALVSGKPLPMLPQTVQLDLPVCLGYCLFAIVPALIFKRFHRLTGIIMLTCYAAYVAVLCVSYAAV